MAEEKKKETRKKAADQQVDQPGAESTEKPKRRRAPRDSSAAKKPAGTRGRAKAAEAGGEEAAAPKRQPARGKTTTRARKGATPKAEAKPQAEPKPESTAGKAATPQAAKPKAPLRRRAARPAAGEPQSRPAPVRPVVTARAKYVRSSARKARLVIDHVRGKPIGEARALLRHSPRGVARDLERLLDSAVANAENNHDLVGDDLYVKEIYADEGPTLKRFRARAQGRAYRIRKRTSHLTVALTPKE